MQFIEYRGLQSLRATLHISAHGADGHHFAEAVFSCFSRDYGAAIPPKDLVLHLLNFFTLIKQVKVALKKVCISKLFFLHEKASLFQFIREALAFYFAHSARVVRLNLFLRCKNLLDGPQVASTKGVL